MSIPKERALQLIAVHLAGGLSVSDFIDGWPPPRIESRPREFHPKPLLEPCGTFSCHTAPIVRTATLP